jgi:peptide methionine sulfoxide reductase MsrB
MGKSGDEGKRKTHRKPKDRSDTPPVEEIATTENPNNTEEVAPETAGTFTCSVCGKKGSPEEGITEKDGRSDYSNALLWARHKHPGVRNATIVFCKECKEKEESAAKTARQEVPGFAPLKCSLERDHRYDEKGNKAEGVRSQLMEKQYEQDMRRVRTDVVCKRCGKHHGQIQYFKNGGFRVTIIDRAMPLNINREDPTALIEVEPICRDCVDLMRGMAEAKHQTFQTFYLGDSFRKAASINEKRSADAAFLNRGQNGRRDPHAKIGDFFPEKRTGTHG